LIFPKNLAPADSQVF